MTDRLQEQANERLAEQGWDGPWRVEGPWAHENGYPQTWTVGNAHRTLCDAPTERGAEMIRAALDDRDALAARVQQLQEALAGPSGKGHHTQSSGVRRCPECLHPQSAPWHQSDCSVAAVLAEVPASEPTGDTT